MVDLLERIGPYLGIAAFLGLAILAFLIFQQAREVRRLREWAGRAPERAGEAADASAAAAEARGETVEPEEEEEEEEEEEAAGEPGRLGIWWEGVRERLASWYAELDRRMPVDPRYFVAVLAAGLIAAGVLTSGFGLVGDDGGGGKGGGGGGGGKDEKPEKVDVAVLNATQIEDAAGTEIQGVQGLAAKVADEVVKPAGFAVGEETDAASGFEETTIMFESGAEGEANDLAKAVADQLGETPVTPIVDEVRELAGGAPLALLIGQDDAEF
jgi:LytR cell envelope-related transcriptional attenuator